MINIKDNILKDIEIYCKINNIDNIEEELNRILRIGLNVLKFGSNPFERMELEKGKIKPTDIEIKEEETKETQVTTNRKQEKQIEETPIIEEPKPKRKYTRKVRIIKNG